MLVKYFLKPMDETRSLFTNYGLAPGSESSRCGTCAPGNFRSLELSLLGTFVGYTIYDHYLRLSK